MKLARILGAVAGLATCGLAAAQSPAPPEDGRVAIVLAAAERAFVLAEMRQFLDATRHIMRGLADNDLAEVGRAARAVGLDVRRDEPLDPNSAEAVIRRKTPPEFRKLGFATRAAFDEVARQAAQPGARELVLKSMSNIYGGCVACHMTYRLVEPRN